MGIPFPLGIHILNERARENIPWVWGINGSASVLGSVFATIVGIIIGFSYAFLLGAAAYFLASLCAVMWVTRVNH